MKTASWLLAAALLILSVRAKAREPWQIHEWGTFTSLQDESGQAIGGINTDDEPVPPFVHEIGFLLLRSSQLPNNFFQGAPSCHPDVTMRLETPVIYFHPPALQAGIQTADVNVAFRGGWLTEYYPDAVPEAPGLTNGVFRFPHLLSSTVGNLEWNDVQIGGNWPLTDTSAHVWTSPRAVDAASVLAANGESEKFLFYRGVGHIDAPLRISCGADARELLFHSQLENLPVDRPLEIQFLWLVDIQPGGKIAFRTLPSLMLDNDSEKILARTSATFRPDQFSAGNFGKLKASLKSALVAEGLYGDEAQALLNTWELSYFKSPGLRVFFLVPRAWTDYYLPLQISLPAQINRVMVGRIELVTPEERETLHQLAAFSPATIHFQIMELLTNFYGNFGAVGISKPSPQQVQNFYKRLQKVEKGEAPLSTALSVPASYQTYLDLGRFRNALVLDEAKTRPTMGLTNFIATYRLQAYQPPGP